MIQIYRTISGKERSGFQQEREKSDIHGSNVYLVHTLYRISLLASSSFAATKAKGQ
jgi:hypothetical protein